MHKVGGIDRKTIDIAVVDQVYKISFVSVYARKLAAEFQEALTKLINIQQAEEAERERLLDELDKDELTRQANTRDEIIQVILESNGYEYDQDWWERNTSYGDQNEFIQFCMMKDVMPDKKKQAKK